MNNSKTIFPKCFYGSVVAIITQHHAFFQCQQVAGIGPLFPCIKRKFIIAGINKYCFFFAVQIVFADINQQIFQVIKIFGIVKDLFS